MSFPKFLRSVYPEKVWKYFYEISKIPRPSNYEEQIADYIIDFALENELNFIYDKVGNVIILPSPYCSAVKNPDKIVTLQAHMDMVAEWDSSYEYDPLVDPIEIEVTEDGKFVTAVGTTLGADNGIGCAMILALLSEIREEGLENEYPPISALFTVDEEIGFVGATELEKGLLVGNKLINLDTASFGSVCVSSAASVDIQIDVNMETEPINQSLDSYEFTLGGFSGGHSGKDIFYEGGNPNKLVARYLNHFTNRDDLEFYISSIDGGNKHNAIPREVKMAMNLDTNYLSEWERESEKCVRKMKTEFDSTDPGIFWNLEKVANDLNEEQFTSESITDLVNILYSIHHGVLRNNRENLEFVLSNNLAKIQPSESGVSIFCMSRSSSYDLLSEFYRELSSIAGLMPEKVSISKSHPSTLWKPKLDSDLLEITLESYRELFEEEMRIYHAHGGLECGEILKKMDENTEAVSIGANIKMNHSPEEEMEIESVEKVFDLLKKVLKKINIS